MAGTTTTRLEALDLALTRLRRLWELPELKQRLIELMGAHCEPSLVRTLRAIEIAEADDPGVGDVASILHVDDSTASRLVEQAVTAGCVERLPSAKDRRRCVLRLTDDGGVLLRAALRARTTLLGHATRDWPPDDVATLATLLDRFTAAVRDEPSP